MRTLQVPLRYHIPCATMEAALLAATNALQRWLLMNKAATAPAAAAVLLPLAGAVAASTVLVFCLQAAQQARCQRQRIAHNAAGMGKALATSINDGAECARSAAKRSATAVGGSGAPSCHRMRQRLLAPVAARKAATAAAPAPPVHSDSGSALAGSVFVPLEAIASIRTAPARGAGTSVASQVMDHIHASLQRSSPLSPDSHRTAAAQMCALLDGLAAEGGDGTGGSDGGWGSGVSGSRDELASPLHEHAPGLPAGRVVPYKPLCRMMPAGIQVRGVRALADRRQPISPGCWSARTSW